MLSRDNPDLVERFAVIGSGEAECKSCQFLYEPKNGDENYPVAKGTRFEDLPADWRCPVCGAEKKMFVSRSKVVAGFRQNQGARAAKRCRAAYCAPAAPAASAERRLTRRATRLRHRRQRDDWRAEVAAHLRCASSGSNACRCVLLCRALMTWHLGAGALATFFALFLAGYLLD